MLPNQIQKVSSFDRPRQRLFLPLLQFYSEDLRRIERHNDWQDYARDRAAW